MKKGQVEQADQVTEGDGLSGLEMGETGNHYRSNCRTGYLFSGWLLILTLSDCHGARAVMLSRGSP